MPRKSWWARLPFGARMVAGTSALLIVIGSVAAGVVVLTRQGPDAPRIVTAVGDAAGDQTQDQSQGRSPARSQVRALPPAPPGPQPWDEVPAGSAGGVGAEAPAKPRRAAKAPTPAPPSDQGVRPAKRVPRQKTSTSRDRVKPAPVRPDSPAAEPPPVVVEVPQRPRLTKRTEFEKREVPFRTRFVRDPMLPRGVRKVQTAGEPGEEKLRYLVTFTDGRKTGRKLMDITVSRPPQDRVIVFGSRRGFDSPPPRYCGDGFELCAFLARSACPQGPGPDPGENTIALGWPVAVPDEDLPLADVLDELPQMNCAGK